MKKSLPAKTSKNKTGHIFWGIAIAIVVIAAIFLLKSHPNNNPAPVDNSTLSIGNSPIIGDKNAPLTIYEFSDFSCPFCEAAEGANQEVIGMLKAQMPDWEAPVPKIKEEYVKTGKAKIVFKYFPGHGAALVAHAVSLGVYKQNPALFEKFAENAFASPSDLMDLGKMKALAVSLGADESALSQYLASGEYQVQLQNEVNMASANGVQGTPTFFINGKVISGAQSFSEFKKVIDAELAKI
jgi:protein-disulfide isomerase